MDRKTVKKIYRRTSCLIVILSFLLLTSSIVLAQKSNKPAKVQSKALKSTGSANGIVTVQAGSTKGTGEVTLQNYTGAALKAIQFRVIATSKNNLISVLPGSSVANKTLWSCHHFIIPGNPDGLGKKSDTINIVIFGNGRTELPAAEGIKLITLTYEQPAVAGTSADTVNFKIKRVIGAIYPGESANVSAGPEVSINLWK